jgi:hypothetical protein
MLFKTKDEKLEEILNADIVDEKVPVVKTPRLEGM